MERLGLSGQSVRHLRKCQDKGHNHERPHVMSLVSRLEAGYIKETWKDLLNAISVPVSYGCPMFMFI